MDEGWRRKGQKKKAVQGFNQAIPYFHTRLFALAIK
jgi:hypothetical protein